MSSQHSEQPTPAAPMVQSTFIVDKFTLRSNDPKTDRRHDSRQRLRIRILPRRRQPNRKVPLFIRRRRRSWIALRTKLENKLPTMLFRTVNKTWRMQRRKRRLVRSITVKRTNILTKRILGHVGEVLRLFLVCVVDARHTSDVVGMDGAIGFDLHMHLA